VTNIEIVDLNPEKNLELFTELSDEYACCVVGGALFPNERACATGLLLDTLGELQFGVLNPGGGLLLKGAGKIAQYVHC
jgi:hypothetical protein